MRGAHAGWPDWTNFRLSGDCLFWVVDNKLPTKNWLGFILGYIFSKVIWSPWHGVRLTEKENRSGEWLNCWVGCRATYFAYIHAWSCMHAWCAWKKWSRTRKHILRHFKVILLQIFGNIFRTILFFILSPDILFTCVVTFINSFSSPYPFFL
jgi:hypothetical protein